jgi:hypothetical protein
LATAGFVSPEHLHTPHHTKVTLSHRRVLLRPEHQLNPGATEHTRPPRSGRLCTVGVVPLIRWKCAAFCPINIQVSVKVGKVFYTGLCRLLENPCSTS